MYIDIDIDIYKYALQDSPATLHVTYSSVYIFIYAYM